MEARAEEYHKRRLVSFAFEKIPCVSFSCKLIPVQYEYGLLSTTDPSCAKLLAIESVRHNQYEKMLTIFNDFFLQHGL